MPSSPPPEKRRDPLLPIDAAARALGRRLLRGADTISLATMASQDNGLAGISSGFPFASLVTMATDYDGAPLLLLSLLAVHTRALNADPRCSLLIRAAPQANGDPLAQPRLSLVGRARRLDRQQRLRAHLLPRFLNRHPRAALYADFPDFDLYRIDLVGGLLNGGFARAYAVQPEDLLAPAQASASDEGERDAFAALAPGLVDSFNNDRLEDVQRVAQELCGAPGGDAWRLAGIDPCGIDLKAEGRSARLEFDLGPVAATALTARIEALVAQARERGD